jgi:hypothetical protein
MIKEFIIGFAKGLVFGTIAALLFLAFAQHVQASTRIERAAHKAGQLYDVDPRLVLAVIEVESQYNPKAVGKYGEVGLMQLHPRYFPEASFNVERNVLMGTAFLAIVRDGCPAQEGITWVNCYNRGTNVALPFPKHTKYYQRVLQAYKRITRK